MKILMTFILLLHTFMLSAQTTTLKLASDVWPPFTDVETKHALALNLVTEALARAKVKGQTDILDFTEAMEGIRSGKFDGSAALWHSPERAEFLLFSEPYLENRLILVGKKGSDVSAATLSALKSKRIAVVESYAYGTLVDKATNIQLITGNSDQQNLERLLKGEADYMLVDALLIAYLLKYQSEEASEHLAIGTTTMLRLPLHFAIRKEIPDAENIVKKFNEEIKEMIALGTYNRILQLNWIATDVDGDGKTELVLNGDKAGTKAPANSYMLISQPDQSASGTSRYFIEGNIYENWEGVPEKYKVPQSASLNSEKQGFGPVFTF